VMILILVNIAKILKKDAALCSVSKPVQVDEPSVVRYSCYFKRIRDRYEAHHRINIFRRSY
ncbi:hypothetical protein ACVQ90_02755, partial [Staphylococcus aureus]